MEKLLLIENIKRYSAKLGFADFGIIPLGKYSKDRERLEKMIFESRAGNMHYLSNNMSLREDPKLLLEGACSAMIFIVSYQNITLQESSLPQIAKYSYGIDYHYVIKQRLSQLCDYIKHDYPQFIYRIFTDSAPIFERSMAVKAGLGFIGKNTMLISRSSGIHNLIGVVISNLESPYKFKDIEDVTTSSICGDCKKCLEKCPTGALIAPFVIDANKCISYNTIENRKEERVGYTHNRVFGCDICIDVCPWSKKSIGVIWDEFRPLKLENGQLITSLSCSDWNNMTSSYFKRNFRNSPLLRAGLKKIQAVLIEQIKYEKSK